jgi:hypothetical protein
MGFYFHKIGEHLQRLAVLAIVLVPLDRRLTLHQVVVSWVVFTVIVLIGIEVERRTR